MLISQGLKIWFTAMVLVLAMGCSGPTTMQGGADTSPTPSVRSSVATTDSTLPSEEVIQRLKAQLAETLGVSTQDIQFETSQAVEWGDACLGLPQADEFCAQVIVPGYQAVFATPQGSYQVHSDRTGESIRLRKLP